LNSCKIGEDKKWHLIETSTNHAICTRQLVLIAERNAKYRLSPQRVNQSFVETVTQNTGHHEDSDYLNFVKVSVTFFVCFFIFLFSGMC